MVVFSLFVSMWPCSEVAICRLCHPAFALRQLGEAPADPSDPEFSKKKVLKLDGWMNPTE